MSRSLIPMFEARAADPVAPGPHDLALAALLRRRSVECGARPALHQKRRGLWRTLTWGALADRVGALAVELTRAGARGRAVAVIGDVGMDALLVALAADEAGAALVLADAGADPAAVTTAGARPLAAVLADTAAAAEAAAGRDTALAGAIERFTAGGDESPGADRVARGPDGSDLILVDRTGDAAAIGPGELTALAARLERGDSAEPVGPGDLALVVEPDSWRASAPLLIHWLAAGFELAVPERADTAAADLRELEPTVLVAEGAWYARLRRDVESRLPAPGTWRRRLVDRALAAGAPGQAARWQTWLVRAPLRRVLGLSRVRVAGLSGSPIDPGATDFFAALGVPIQAGDPARAAAARAIDPAALLGREGAA